MVLALHEAFPTSSFFSACAPDVPCITPGTYAFLGAAAALSGIMHITVTVVVIMFELTGALTYILPTMIVVGVTKAVSDWFGNGGIADRMIWFNGFPFLDNKEEHTFGVPVSRVMSSDLTVVLATGMNVNQVEELVRKKPVQGFPFVESEYSNILIGYIGQTELRYAIDRARKDLGATSDSPVVFTPTDGGVAPLTPRPDRQERTFQEAAESAGQAPMDLSKYVETPITVHPRLPLETVMELFKKLGPRVILIEYRGRVAGLVTVKDVLKYQFQEEAHENPKDDGAEDGILGRREGRD